MVPVAGSGTHTALLGTWHLKWACGSLVKATDPQPPGPGSLWPSSAAWPVTVSPGGAEGTHLAPRLWCLLWGPEERLVHKAGAPTWCLRHGGVWKLGPSSWGGRWVKWPCRRGQVATRGLSCGACWGRRVWEPPEATSRQELGVAQCPGCLLLVFFFLHFPKSCDGMEIRKQNPSGPRELTCPGHPICPPPDPKSAP